MDTPRERFEKYYQGWEDHDAGRTYRPDHRWGPVPIGDYSRGYKEARDSYEERAVAALLESSETVEVGKAPEADA